MSHLLIDCLQYSNWSRPIFQQIRDAGVSGLHVTICYHENFIETVRNITKWNDYFADNSDLIFHGKYAADVERAQAENRVAVFYGFQNCSPIEDDVRLVEIFHQLGVRFMQLSYNNQSLLATGCYEANDTGITRMGREVIKEMNRVGMVIDMSHSANHSTLQAIELSTRPIAITHANPHSWHAALRNKPDNVLRALAQSGGMLGFSIYPHHLKDKSQCSVQSFCEMIARTADIMGVTQIGFGSDLCLEQPDSVVEWMRNGRWTKAMDYGEGSKDNAGFPKQPEWFENSTGFVNILAGLKQTGFNDDEIALIAGKNWLKFFRESFVGKEG